MMQVTRTSVGLRVSMADRHAQGRREAMSRRGRHKQLPAVPVERSQPATHQVEPRATTAGELLTARPRSVVVHLEHELAAVESSGDGELAALRAASDRMMDGVLDQRL